MYERGLTCLRFTCKLRPHATSTEAYLPCRGLSGGIAGWAARKREVPTLRMHSRVGSSSVVAAISRYCADRARTITKPSPLESAFCDHVFGSESMTV